MAGEHPHVLAAVRGGRRGRQGLPRLAGLPVPHGLHLERHRLQHVDGRPDLVGRDADPDRPRRRAPSTTSSRASRSTRTRPGARRTSPSPTTTSRSRLQHEHVPADRRLHVVARRRRELDARASEIGGPMKVPWIANTNQGHMVGDYISTSFTGDGKAHPVFSLAKPPDSGVNGSCYPNNTGCHQRLTSATLRHHAPAAEPSRCGRAGSRSRVGCTGIPKTRRSTSGLRTSRPAESPARARGGARRGTTGRPCGERILAVEHVCAGLFEQLLRLSAPLDADDRVEGAVADRDPRERWCRGRTRGRRRSGGSR